MPTGENMVKLERMLTAAPPELRRLVTWGGTDLVDTLTRHYADLGLPPMQARREAEAATRILLRRMIGIVKSFHRWGV